MPISQKQGSRNAERSRSIGDTVPQPALIRRGIAFTRLCLLVSVFCAAAFAQSTSIHAPTVELVGEPATDSAIELTIEPVVSKLLDTPQQQLQPGDFGFAPLRGQERVTLFFKGYLASPVSYLAMATSAGAGFIAGEPEGWGRTFRGYGQRAGTEFVYYTAEEAVHDVGDAALGLDPRYFPCHCTGLWHRSRNALAMTLLAYDGNGKLHLDLPRFVGNYGTSMLVTTWYPAAYSPFAQGIKMGHVEVGLDAGVNLLREFSPEIKQFLRALKLAKAMTP